MYEWFGDVVPGGKVFASICNAIYGKSGGVILHLSLLREQSDEMRTRDLRWYGKLDK